jgi:hypothetical protein
MTPQERQLVDDLFDRLARLETAPRDADAERAIAEGWERAPNAAYALVQTVLVQDEALKRADARIRELSGDNEPASEGGGFLDSMRNTISGAARGSVPRVQPGSSYGTPDPRWNSGGALGASPQAQAAAPASGGSSFLGTAAASAVGVIGGAMLFNTIGSLFGHHGSANAAPFAGPDSRSPWGNDAAGSDLARDAGLNDITGGPTGEAHGASLFDNSDNTDTSDFDGDVGADAGGDIGGDFGGDT